MIFKGEFPNWYLSEREVQALAPASRHSVRFALSMLQAEGWVTSEHGVGWHFNNYKQSCTFELFANLLDFQSPTEWPALISELLEFRTRQVVAGVDALVTSGLRASSDARFALAVLQSQRAPEDIIAVEDLFIAELLSAPSLLDRLQAHQVRRTFERVRELMPPDVEVESQLSTCLALVAAIDSGDRLLALRLAEKIATARDPLYVRVARAAARAEEEPAMSAAAH